MRVRDRLAAATMMTLAATIEAPAANYALVVGVNDYDVQPDLGGAVNDAKLIAGALAEFGVADMIVLLDGAADYAALTAAWEALLAQAAPGDTLIFTYSGHGGRTEDLDGDEAGPSQPGDVHDETLILPGYDPQSAAGRGERLVDDELHHWFVAARDKGVQVVFLADSCHSGTVNRGGRARVLSDYMSLVQDAGRRPAPRDRETPEEQLDNVVFLAGAREAELVYEVEIEGRFHGALSYAFARALSLAGDLDGDGALGRDDLATFLPRTAKSFNGASYLPELVARGGADFVVLHPDPAAAAAMAAPAGPDGAVIDTAGLEAGRVYLAGAPGTYWEQATGNLVDAGGEVLGYAIPRNRLPQVEGKFAALALAREGLVRRGFDLGLRVDGAPWHRELSAGAAFEVVAGPLPHRYLTLFNLANNGEVQPIYPFTAAERAPTPPGTTVRFPAEVQPPFGADELVAVATATPPQALWEALQYLLPAGDLVPILARLLAQDGVAFAHHSLVTKE